MQQLAVIINGEWQMPQATQAPLAPQAVSNNSSRALTPEIAVNEIVCMLARAIALAQTLPPEDQRRVRDFGAAFTATLTATTYLPKADQHALESALRAAAAKG